MRDGDMFDRMAVARLLADIGSDETGARESASDGEGGEEPGRLGEQIMEGNRVGCTVGTGPSSGRQGCGQVLDFAALARGKRDVHAPAPEASALKTAVPDSSSEPTMRRAVPERVTSVSDILPCKAASDCRSNCEA